MVKLLLYKRKNLSMLKNFIADGIIYGLSPWALIICTLLYNHQSIINNIIFLKIKRSILGHLLQSLAIPIANFIALFVDYRNQMICFLKSKYDDGKSLCEKVKWVVISFLETLKNILCIQKPSATYIIIFAIYRLVDSSYYVCIILNFVIYEKSYQPISNIYEFIQRCINHRFSHEHDFYSTF